MYKFINVFHGSFEAKDGKTIDYKKVNVLLSDGSVMSLKTDSKKFNSEETKDIKMGADVNIDFIPDSAGVARVIKVNKA